MALVEKYFEIRAFLPNMVAAQASPLAGLDSFFYRIYALDAADAYKRFLALDFIELQLQDIDPNIVIFVVPKQCIFSYVSEIKQPTPTDPIPPTIAKVSYLQRVK